MTPDRWIILVPIIGGVTYHMGQKLMPASTNGMLALAGVYLAAALVCVAGYFLAPALGGASIGWNALPALGLVTIGILFIEVGFLLTYRLGGMLSSASLTFALACALVLFVAGALFFGERVTPTQLLGMVLAIGGLVLIRV